MGTLKERLDSGFTRIGNYLRDSVVPRLVPTGGNTGQVLTKQSSGFAWSAGNGADPWTYVALSAAVLNTTVNAVDTLLKFTPQANKRYAFEAKLIMQSAATTTGVRPGLKWPTAGVLQSGAKVESPISATGSVVRFWGSPSSANAAATAVPVANENLLGTVDGIIVTGAAPAGDMIITLASEVAASEVRLMENSFLRYREF